jgi:formylglycine-generating enzyme
MAAGALACDQESGHAPAASSSVAPRSIAPTEPLPELLYLPDGGDIAPPRSPGQQLLPGPWGMRSARCGADMVDVRGQFCIDRYESVLVDNGEGREISPYYPPTRAQTKSLYALWQKKRPSCATEEGRTMSIPGPPGWQLKEEFEPRAAVRAGVPPNGYTSGQLAERACKNAGKRLCRPDEWVVACRGEKNRKFPYGTEYVNGLCNVFRESHPALVLHQNPSINHSDPRLNLVSYRGRPLLRRTGEAQQCKSEWGADAVYDMVGNLDEWVDDPNGMFLGGFYARSTREGCDASITAHPPSYFDYSLGVRCCK